MVPLGKLPRAGIIAELFSAHEGENGTDFVELKSRAVGTGAAVFI
jgi:hypothetical protein